METTQGADRTDEVQTEDQEEMVTLKTLGVLDVQPGDILIVQPEYKLKFKRFARLREMLDQILASRGIKDVTCWFVPHDIKVGVLRASDKPDRVVDISNREQQDHQEH